MQSTVQSVYSSCGLLQKSPHFHDCHQIILVVKGSAKFCVNDKIFVAEAGNIAIFSRYENHSVVGCSNDYERYVLHIDPTVVNRKSPVYSLLTDRPVGFFNVINVAPYFDQIKEMFMRILQEHKICAKLWDEMEQLAVKQLLITIYRCIPVDFDSSQDAVVIGVKRQFENQYSELYTLDTLAKQYNVSVSALSHRFRAATGVSVMEYLQSCRIAQAKRMLVESDLCIGDIVEKCGFSDCSNFSRTFKKTVGITPTQFKKKYV